MGPIAIYNYISNTKKWSRKNYVNIVVIVIAFVLTFSSSGYLVLLLSSIIFIIKYNSKIFQLFSFTKLIIFSSVLFVLYISIDFAPDLFTSAFTKLTFNRQNQSVDSRLISLELSYEFIKASNWFGIGLGKMSVMGHISSINWYVHLLTEAGIIPLLILLLFIYTKIYEYTFVSNNYSKILYFSIISSFIYLSTLSTFHAPFLWILLALNDNNIVFCQSHMKT